MTRVTVEKNGGHVTVSFTDFPDEDGRDYWDDLMFIALPLETTHNVFYQGINTHETGLYHKADRIEFIFTDQQPRRADIKRFITDVLSYLEVKDG